jgi:hypothetical protein
VKWFQIPVRKRWGVSEEMKYAGFYSGHVWKLGSMGKVEAHSKEKWKRITRKIRDN